MLECGHLAERELKFAVRLERLARLALLLECRRKADGGLVGRSRPARGLARAAIHARSRSRTITGGAARIGGAKKQICWSSGAEIADSPWSAGSMSPAAISARIDSRVARLAMTGSRAPTVCQAAALSR